MALLSFCTASLLKTVDSERNGSFGHMNLEQNYTMIKSW